MGIISDLSEKYRTLSIIGMAKNAGKTTALNYLIEEAEDEGILLGVTSTGRDGETIDLVTESDKPRVYLYEDTIVSIPTKLFELADAGLEILEISKFRTPLGELLLCRVKESGYVQIAGPVASADTRRMCGRMFGYGADMILIDGAIDRKSVAAPETSDAIILSTGAVLSRNMKNIVSETAHIVELYSLPVIKDDKKKELVSAGMDDNDIMLVKKDSVTKLNLNTGLGMGRYIDGAIDDETVAVYIPGAFTKSVISDIEPAKFKKISFILKDPTKIFIDAISWRRLRKKGLKVEVMKNIEVAMVTVNPHAPEGYSFDSKILCREMEKALPDIPVIDVRN